MRRERNVRVAAVLALVWSVPLWASGKAYDRHTAHKRLGALVGDVARLLSDEAGAVLCDVAGGARDKESSVGCASRGLAHVARTVAERDATELRQLVRSIAIDGVARSLAGEPCHKLLITLDADFRARICGAKTIESLIEWATADGESKTTLFALLAPDGQPVTVATGVLGANRAPEGNTAWSVTLDPTGPNLTLVFSDTARTDGARWQIAIERGPVAWSVAVVVDGAGGTLRLDGFDTGRVAVRERYEVVLPQRGGAPTLSVAIWSGSESGSESGSVTGALELALEWAQLEAMLAQIADFVGADPTALIGSGRVVAVEGRLWDVLSAAGAGDRCRKALDGALAGAGAAINGDWSRHDSRPTAARFGAEIAEVCIEEADRGALEQIRTAYGELVTARIRGVVHGAIAEVVRGLSPLASSRAVAEAAVGGDATQLWTLFATWTLQQAIARAEQSSAVASDFAVAARSLLAMVASASHDRVALLDAISTELRRQAHIGLDEATERYFEAYDLSHFGPVLHLAHDLIDIVFSTGRQRVAIHQRIRAALDRASDDGGDESRNRISTTAGLAASATLGVPLELSFGRNPRIAVAGGDLVFDHDGSSLDMPLPPSPSEAVAPPELRASWTGDSARLSEDRTTVWSIGVAASTSSPAPRVDAPPVSEVLRDRARLFARRDLTDIVAKQPSCWMSALGCTFWDAVSVGFELETLALYNFGHGSITGDNAALDLQDVVVFNVQLIESSSFSLDSGLFATGVLRGLGINPARLVSEVDVTEPTAAHFRFGWGAYLGFFDAFKIGVLQVYYDEYRVDGRDRTDAAAFVSYQLLEFFQIGGDR